MTLNSHFLKAPLFSFSLSLFICVSEACDWIIKVFVNIFQNFVTTDQPCSLNVWIVLESFTSVSDTKSIWRIASQSLRTTRTTMTTIGWSPIKVSLSEVIDRKFFPTIEVIFCLMQFLQERLHKLNVMRNCSQFCLQNKKIIILFECVNILILLQKMKMRKSDRLRVSYLNPRLIWRRMPTTTRILTCLSISAKTVQESFTDKKAWKSTNL